MGDGADPVVRLFDSPGVRVVDRVPALVADAADSTRRRFRPCLVGAVLDRRSEGPPPIGDDSPLPSLRNRRAGRILSAMNINTVIGRTPSAGHCPSTGIPAGPHRRLETPGGRGPNPGPVLLPIQSPSWTPFASGPCGTPIGGRRVTGLGRRRLHRDGPGHAG